MAKQNLNNTTNMSRLHAREIDFVTRFTGNWDALRTILGIMRPIRKAPGTTLKSLKVEVEELATSPAEGEEIPYSKPTYTPVAYEDLTVEKYATGTTIEAVEKYGARAAVEKTDEAFLTKLQNVVMGRFYTFLATGTLTKTAATFQAGVASAIGSVKHKFQTMNKDCTEVVVFVNTLDAYAYLGTADVTIQSEFGITYIQNFLGARTIVLTDKVAEGKIIATPVDNIVLYYIDPDDSEFHELGLEYTVEGETNLVGFHAQGDYSHAVGECYALMGLTMWAEYLDAIAVVTFGE